MENKKDTIYTKDNISSEEIRKAYQEERFNDLSVTKKTIITLPKNTHTEFRVLSFKERVSMNLILTEFIEQLVGGDEYLLDMVRNLVIRKQNQEIKNLSKFDLDAVYDLIGSQK